MSFIYLDHNATTPAAPQVVEAMAPFWRERFGNASSPHGAGQSARNAIESARAQVAGLIGARPRDVVFTSGGTESNNLAIAGALGAAAVAVATSNAPHVVTTLVEHVSVLNVYQQLQRSGIRVTWIGVDSHGRLDLDAFTTALDAGSTLASVMHANNETGVVFPIEEIAGIANDRGVLLHVDACQSAGRLPLDVARLGRVVVSLSAHKMHGPKGSGALFVAPGVRITGVLRGGHQERELRPGTENVPAIVGFGVAADLARERMPELNRLAALRDRLEAGLIASVDGATPIAADAPRLPNTSYMGFAGLEAEALLIALNEAGLCAGSGSACSSGSLEPSHVLAAMGCAPSLTESAIRFSLSQENTADEIDRAIKITTSVVDRLRTLSR